LIVKRLNLYISQVRMLCLLGMLFMSLSVSAQVTSERANMTDDKVKVHVYPNPTSDQITIDLSKTEVKKPVIEIRSIIGSKMQVTVEKIALQKYKVDVSRFPRGYYLVLVREDREKFQQTVRFSKK